MGSRGALHAGVEAPAPTPQRRRRALALLLATIDVAARRAPPALLLAIGRAIGELAALALPRLERRLTEHHRALLGVPPRSPRRFLRAVLRHYGLLAIEVLLQPRLVAGELTRWIDTRELHRAVRRLHGAGAPVLCTSGHFGNWEWAGAAACRAGLPLEAVARPLDDPLLDQFLVRRREEAGIVVHSKWNVVWALKKALDRGAAIAINADQHARGPGAVRVRFGTRSAATFPTIAQLHLMTGAPILVGSVVRTRRGAPYRFVVLDVIEREGTERDSADIVRVLERVGDALTKGIAAYREQYLWTHRRWR